MAVKRERERNEEEENQSGPKKYTHNVKKYVFVKMHGIMGQAQASWGACHKTSGEKCGANKC